MLVLGFERQRSHSPPLNLFPFFLLSSSWTIFWTIHLAPHFQSYFPPHRTFISHALYRLWWSHRSCYLFLQLVLCPTNFEIYYSSRCKRLKSSLGPFRIARCRRYLVRRQSLCKSHLQMEHHNFCLSRPFYSQSPWYSRSSPPTSNPLCHFHRAFQQFVSHPYHCCCESSRIRRYLCCYSWCLSRLPFVRLSSQSNLSLPTTFFNRILKYHPFLLLLLLFLLVRRKFKQ